MVDVDDVRVHRFLEEDFEDIAGFSAAVLEMGTVSRCGNQ